MWCACSSESIRVPGTYVVQRTALWSDSLLLVGSRVQTLVLRLGQHVLQPDEPCFWISICIFITITLCMPTTGYQSSESDLRKWRLITHSCDPRNACPVSSIDSDIRPSEAKMNFPHIREHPEELHVSESLILWALDIYRRISGTLFPEIINKFIPS